MPKNARSYGPRNMLVADREKIRNIDDQQPRRAGLLIGRRVLSKALKDHVDRHPLAQLAELIKANSENDRYGEAVEPDMLMLQLLTPGVFDALYENAANRKGHSNATLRRKNANISSIKKHIGEIFDEQKCQDVAVQFERIEASRTNHARTIYEDDIEYYDLTSGPTVCELPEEIGAHFKRGPAKMKLRKRYSRDDDGNLGVRPVIELSKEIITDDLDRINTALREVGLLGERNLTLGLDDMELFVPVFKLKQPNIPEDHLPFFPLVPMGLIEFQPLSIHAVDYLL